MPESHAIQRQLSQVGAENEWRRGGAPIKLRIVKGANMEMEKLESVINNWPLAPFDSKLAVDANYKRMVEYGMRPETYCRRSISALPRTTCLSLPMPPPWQKIAR